MQSSHSLAPIQITNLNYRSETCALTIDHLTIQADQHWVIFSTHSQCGSLFGRLLAGDLPIKRQFTGDYNSNKSVQCRGEVTGLPKLIGCVSLYQQQLLLDKELLLDDTDFMDQLDYGSSVESLILEQCQDKNELDDLLQLLDITHLRHRGFRQLSTGETRRLMLARALAIHPQLLILDEPYAGLDIEHQKQLAALLNQLSKTIQLIIVTSREDEVPECVTHVAMFNLEQDKSGELLDGQSNNRLSEPMSVSAWREHPVMGQLKALSSQRSDEMLTLIKKQRYQAKYPDPLVELKQAKVEYTDGLIFSGLDWRIHNGEHWQIRGPNGCGKSTLLGLILGDHPQCYSNDITLFGKPRGSGETIWQVKEQIGVVSSALHLQYRVNCTVLEVLLSGFFDSIGLYQNPTKKQIELAKEWLAILHMSEFEKMGFKQLEYGQQRLLLVGRALIKQPVLLILDEAYQGLDFINRKLVMNALNMIANENLSQLLYVSHHVDDTLPAITNFVDFIGDGKVKVTSC